MKRALAPLLIAVALVLAVGAAAADAPVRTVTIPGKLYDPPHLDVLVGTTVTWKNDDAINHTVTADGDAFSSGYVPPGGSFSFTFAKQGRYPFHCTIHKFMKGEVDVFGLVLSGPEGPVARRQPRRLRRARAGRGRDRDAPRRRRGAHRSRAARRELRRRRRTSALPARTEPSRGRWSARSCACSSVRSFASRRWVTPCALAPIPARPGARAVLQSYDREHFAWRGVARGSLDARSSVRFPIPGGVDRVRVLVVGGKGWADAASRVVVLGPA